MGVCSVNIPIFASLMPLHALLLTSGHPTPSRVPHIIDDNHVDSVDPAAGRAAYAWAAVLRSPRHCCPSSSAPRPGTPTMTQEHGTGAAQTPMLRPVGGAGTT